jgi:hypothetical protein
MCIFIHPLHYIPETSGTGIPRTQTTPSVQIGFTYRVLLTTESTAEHKDRRVMEKGAIPSRMDSFLSPMALVVKIM